MAVLLTWSLSSSYTFPKGRCAVEWSHCHLPSSLDSSDLKPKGISENQIQQPNWSLLLVCNISLKMLLPVSGLSWSSSTDMFFFFLPVVLREYLQQFDTIPFRPLIKELQTQYYHYLTNCNYVSQCILNEERWCFHLMVDSSGRAWFLIHLIQST